MDGTDILLAFVAIALGGVLKGATGAGAPLVGVPVLAIILGVPAAVAIFSVLNLMSNSWQTWAFRSEIADRRFACSFAATGGIGAAVGSVLLATLPVRVMMAALALLVFAYIALRLARPGWQLSRAAGRRIGPYAGLAGGVMQGAGGISAPVSLTFLNALSLPRGEFIGTISVYFLVMSLLQVPALAIVGLLTPERAGLAVAGLVPLLLGMPVGSWAARYLSRRAFDRLILALLAVIACKLIWDALA